MITPLVPTPTPYLPDPSLSRVDWGEFGKSSEKTFVWIVNFFEYLSKLLFEIPISNPDGLFPGVTFGMLLVYFIFMYAVLKYVFGIFGAGFKSFGSKSDFGGKLS